MLLEKLPEETTQLLIDICTGSGFTEPSEEEKSDPSKGGTTGGASYLSYLPYARNSILVPADASPTIASTGKEKEKEKQKDSTSAGGSSGNELPGQRKRQSTMRSGSMYSSSMPPSPPPPTSKLKPLVRKPSPRVYFVHFVDHPEHFVRFLEAIALARWGQKVDVKGGTSVIKGFSNGKEEQAQVDPDIDRQDRAAVWNTLIELYLTLSSRYLTKDPPDNEASKSMHTKALHVLKGSFEYDPTHALLVCSTRQFIEGQILLWEKLGMYEDILRFWIDQERALTSGAEYKGTTRPSVEVLRHLNRYGETNPHLYPLVLRFLTSTPALLQRHTQELTRILEHIEQEKIMPPLAVVQVLSRNGVSSVGLVKQWLMRRISKSKSEIESVSSILCVVGSLLTE